jgi:UDP-glucose 4-epimerase
LRYFTASVATAEASLCEEHDPETHLIPLDPGGLGIRRSVDVFATDYPTPDGPAIRDYIRVEDLARAHLLALERLRAAPAVSSNLVNHFPDGGPCSGAEVERLAGFPDFTVRKAPQCAGDPPASVADATRAPKALAWTPQLSDLPTIVKTAWDSLDQRMRE